VSCPHRFDVAPYALGTLDADERADVAEHLPGCPECRAVLESVAGLPGLLARIDPDDIAPAPEVADEAMFQRLLARTADVRPEPRPGPRRRLVLAAAAAAVLAVGGGWALHAASTDDGTRVVTASSGPVHASVRVTPTPGGTSVRLELSGVEAEQRCRLVAVDRDGHRAVAATWEAGYTGTATFQGSVPVPVDRLASLRVETDTATLLTFPLT
jgi:Putative zinc-finger